MAALFVVAAVLRLGAGESGQRAEPVLAHSGGPLRWVAGHLAVAFGGSALILLLGRLGRLGLGFGRGQSGALGQTVGGALAQLPAVWVIGAVAALLYGVLPGHASADWAVAGAALILGWIGPALNLPRAVLDLSPFAHLPRIPGSEALTWGSLLTLTALEATLLAAAPAALRHRDLAA
ncbi:hypothetical protein ACIQV3_19835 [Streptomyces sp. NPDC099050]|uniref:hypothetical protein n=1 Tax=Streptomyces sp. NPDC099050 TaxID=3366100 RepID=UPI00380A3B50